MLKFYRWLRIWATRKTHEYVHCNIRCPKCNTWSSEVEGKSILDTEWGYVWRCGQCQQATRWNSSIAPFPLRCDIDGNPLESENVKTVIRGQ